MSAKRKSFPWLSVGILTGLVLGLWLFPGLWYERSPSGRLPLWLSENPQIPEWQYRELPVAESVERVLVADHLVNGEFRHPKGAIIRVFSAKRYTEKSGEIGLFVHTPDRCWTESGWQIRPGAPESLSFTMQGLTLLFERRLFQTGARRELVYFAGLAGGLPLPFRLDHNLAVARRQSGILSGDRTQFFRRLVDSSYWRRIWDSFCSRRPLQGPKQFLRVSTEVMGDDLPTADQRLQEFLPRWLQPGDYEKEREAFRRSAQRTTAGDTR